MASPEIEKRPNSYSFLRTLFRAKGVTLSDDDLRFAGDLLEDFISKRLLASEERAQRLESVFGHTHMASRADGGSLLDKCARCGLDLRDPIHLREAVRHG